MMKIQMTLCFIGFLVCFISAFPGHSNFDEFYAINSFFENRLSDIQPPAQTILWSNTILFAEKLGLSSLWQAALLLILQLSLFWISFYFLLNTFKEKKIGIIFALIMIVSPISLLYLSHIGKDSQMAISFFISAILINKGIKKQKLSLIVLSITFIFYGFIVRSNGPAAGFFLIFYAIFGIYRVRNFRVNHIKILFFTLLLSIIFIFIHKEIKNNYFKVTGSEGLQLVMLPIQEIMAISYANNVNLIPNEFYADPNYSLKNIKNNFKPMYPFWDGLRNDIGLNEFPNAMSAWVHAVKKYPYSYIDYKLNFLKILFGLNDGPAYLSIYKGFYINDDVLSAHKMIHISNSFRNIPLQFKKIQKEFGRYFKRNADSLFFRAWFYILLGIFSFSLISKENRLRLSFENILFLSALFYILPYIVVGSSASIRYFLWPALALTTLFFIRIDNFIFGYKRKKGVLK